MLYSPPVQQLWQHLQQLDCFAECVAAWYGAAYPALSEHRLTQRTSPLPAVPATLRLTQLACTLKHATGAWSTKTPTPTPTKTPIKIQWLCTKAPQQYCAYRSIQPACTLKQATFAWCTDTPGCALRRHNNVVHTG